MRKVERVLFLIIVPVEFMVFWVQIGNVLLKLRIGRSSKTQVFARALSG